MRKTLLEILFVEDDTGDVELMLSALEKHEVKASLEVAQDGEAALDYLYRKGPHSNATRPDLILLDLNLPKKDGRQVLSEIREDESLRQIPIITFTTSNDEADILETYGLGSSTYVTKPQGNDGYDKVLEIIRSYI